MTTKPTEVVVAVAFDKDGRFLMTSRPEGKVYAGYWEFPGGKLEPGETGEQAIVREIQEELEVTIGNLDYLCTVEHDYETFHLSMQCYLASILSGEFKEHAHEDMKWLDTNNLWDVDWLPADVKVVRELEKKLGLK